MFCVSELPPAPPSSFDDYPSQESLTEDELAPVFNSSLEKRRSRKRYLDLLAEKRERGEKLTPWEIPVLVHLKQ